VLDGATGAVDIGGTKIAVGLVDRVGKLLWSAEAPTRACDGPEAALVAISAMLRDAARHANQQVLAVGVGCTGPVDPNNGVVGDVALLPGWEGFPVSSRLENLFQVPVRLENDCDAAALGELRYGSGMGAKRFLYVTVSTGVGAGFLLDGRIDRGVMGAHAEAGHHTIEASGPACYCGATGCWESLASGVALANSYRAAVGASEDCSAEEVFRKARNQDVAAVEAVARFTYYLGIGLGNLMTLYAPEVIALGGGILESRDQFLDQAVEIARSRARLVPASKIDIRPAALGRQAALIGAACLGQDAHTANEDECTHA
jgi:glucokinase